MLAYFLAILMAITSLFLLFNAFGSPQTRRPDDFLWSGLGLFYALILWLCSGRFTGAVLLGQIAGVAIAIAFVWENRQLRKAITAESDSNEVLEGFSVLNLIIQSLTKVSSFPKTTPSTPPESVVAEGTPEVIASEESPSTETKAEPEIVAKDKEAPSIISDTESESSTVAESVATPTVEEKITPESVSETAAITEEVTGNLEAETTSTPENQEEEEFFGSSLVSESESKTQAKKPNIFTRIFGIFRKSEPEKAAKPTGESQTEISTQILEEVETDVVDNEVIVAVDDATENIDAETTATEVEEAIENLELTDTDEQPENEVIASAEEQDNISATEEAVGETDIEGENETLTVAEESETISQGESVSETIQPSIEAEVQKEVEETETQTEVESNQVSETIEAEVATQTEAVLEEIPPTVIEAEAKEEIVTEELSPENTAEDVPEDDIIESLSDLFPRSDESPTDNQAEALEGDQENNQDNDDDDKSKDND